MSPRISRRLTLQTCAVALLAGATIPSQAQAAANMRAATRESPFACDRLALSPAARHRHFDVLGPILRTKVSGAQEAPDGYRFRFPSDSQTLMQLSEWMDGERLCCPFFDFDVRIAREGGGLWLALSGRPGTKEFIRADFAPWIART